MDLLAIGGITLDHLFWTDRLPQKHFEATIREYGLYFGGRASNVAVAARKLGLKTGIVSPVGSDFISSGYEHHLVELGVDMRGIIRVPAKKTKQIFIFTDSQGNQITFFDFGAESFFKEMKIPVDLIIESRIVHITSSGDYKFNIQSAKAAHDNDVLVSFDPANDPSTEIPEYLQAMIPYTKFLFMNDVEVSGIVKRLGLGDVKEILNLGPHAVIVIDKNSKSSIVYTMDAVQKIPSVLRQTKDPTGASDAYIAAFLVGCLRGYNLKTAGMLGAVEASFVVESFGSQTNLPDWGLIHKRRLSRLKLKS